jgi:hypothetical protein
VKFLARLLDRLSWPALIVAGVVLVAIALALSISVHEVDVPLSEFGELADWIRPGSLSPAPSEATVATEPPASPPHSVATERSAVDPPKLAADTAQKHSGLAAALTENLRERIRKQVHDELARVQVELEQTQKEALQEQEEQRREAEQAIKEARQEFAEKQREGTAALRDAAKEYAERRREIQTEIEEEEADRSDDQAGANSAPGCHFQNLTLRCQFQPDKAAKPPAPTGKQRELEQELRDALKEFESKRRDATRDMQDAQAELDRVVAEAQKQITNRVVILGDNKTIRIPEINVPPIRLPDVSTSQSPPASAPPVPGKAAAPPAFPPAPSAPAAPAAPAAPMSKDAMLMVERDVGSAVADTVGEEVHSALKGYQLAISGMLVGIALLLFSGAVIGKTVMTSNRAARARADLLRVEAERNLMSKQVVEAQLKMMQAQVEPHFLFNTLANVRFLQESDAASAGTMLDHLIDYLHAALPQMRESSTTLAKETELARAYLEILRIRMGGRLTFAIQVPEALHGVSFPPMMLLSLVENAIKHGLEPMREGGRVDIEATLESGRLKLAVKDTGAGLAATAGAHAGSGVGLANIRERLKTMYGESARLSLIENQPHGVIAAIEIPYGEANNSPAG